MTSFPENVARYCTLPMDRYTAVNDELPRLADIRAGIVFAQATWSVASKLAFVALNGALAKCVDIPDIRVFVIDTESPLAEEWFTMHGPWGGGYGETYWVKDGRIVAQLAAYSDRDAARLKEFTEMLR